jgi:predicted SAM-dependent methyltransferase
MSIRDLRDRFLPFLTKQRVLFAVNPCLRVCQSEGGIRSRLAPVLRQHRIEHLDLGGWTPVEQYLMLHLSPVELYGWPAVRLTTFSQKIDEGTGIPHLVARPLERPAVSLSFDATRGLPINDGSLQGVNLSHFLEHFDLAAGRALLRDCRRVLRPGGVVRVSCPDLRKYAQAYPSGNAQFFSVTGSPALCNYRNLPTNGAIFAGKAYDADNGHKWFYDAETIVALLREAGFGSAAERELHQSDLPRIADVKPAYRATESFYVEGLV